MNLNDPDIWTVCFLDRASTETTWHQTTGEALSLSGAEAVLARMSPDRGAYITDIPSSTAAYRAAGAFHDDARRAALRHSHWDTAAADGDYYAACGTPSDWEHWASDRNV